MSTTTARTTVRPCFAMQRSNKCLYGDKCHFSHDPAVLSATTFSNRSNRPISKVQKQLYRENQENQKHIKQTNHTAFLQRQGERRKLHQRRYRPTRMEQSVPTERPVTAKPKSIVIDNQFCVLYADDNSDNEADNEADDVDQEFPELNPIGTGIPALNRSTTKCYSAWEDTRALMSNLHTSSPTLSLNERKRRFSEHMDGGDSSDDDNNASPESWQAIFGNTPIGGNWGDCDSDSD
jgi:hypothetical protein